MDHHTSSEDLDEADASVHSNSSGIDSGASSLSEHCYNTKKRKRTDSLELDSDFDELKRSKKRKYMKEKHSERRRRSNSMAKSISGLEDVSSASEWERSSSVSKNDVELIQPHLRSVVIKCYGSSEEANQPILTISNLKEYQRSVSPETPLAAYHTHEREREVQRFYRSFSKERRQQQYQDQYQQCDRELNARIKEYEDHRFLKEEYQRRPRKQEERYHQREDTRSFNNYNKYGKRVGLKRREFKDRRDYRERRSPLGNDRWCEIRFPDREKRYQEEDFSFERLREVRREKPISTAGRPDEPAAPHHMRSRSRSQGERNRRLERPSGKEERFRNW